MRCIRGPLPAILVGYCCLWPVLLSAQESSINSGGMQQILDRLARLERQNQQLLEEVQALRAQIGGQPAAAAPAAVPEAASVPVEERVAVQEQRTADLAATKVEASQKRPLSITGMALFNSYINGRHNGAADHPTVASLNATPAVDGGTFRQSVIGLRYQSPNTVWGAQVNGSLYLDLFANSGANPTPDRAISNNLGRLVRLRVATIELEWKDRSVLVGNDKPIVSPREPSSLSWVGVSPLTGAGNPWLWQPEIRYEERVRFNDTNLVRLQAGVFQTAEGGATVSDVYAPTLESSRPGYEARIEYQRDFANGGHLEIAPSVHASTTHVAFTSVPSRLYGVDWSIAPVRKLDFTGMFYSGENIANLGTIRQGFTVLGPGNAIPIHSLGGWGQLSYTFTPRLTFNIYSGQHNDRAVDLRGSGISKNFVYAGNAMYHLAPNVILSFEANQIRTTYLGAGQRLNNHYDLALAYLF